MFDKKTLRLEEAIIKYGICSVHIDVLKNNFSEERMVLLIEEAVEIIQKRGIDGQCVMCKIDIARFVKKDLYSLE